MNRLISPTLCRNLCCELYRRFLARYVVVAVLTTGCFGSHARHERHANDFLEDKVTAARVQGALGTNFPAVQVVVSNGVAHLTGSVSSADQKERAAALARGVERVRGVQSDVRVTP